MSTAPIRPHPTLDRYYGSDSERAAAVRDLFDDGAPHYEWICRVMSLGTGDMYRRQALRDAGFEPGMRLLDVATGTGPILRAAVAAGGGAGLVAGLDPSGGMLRECRKRCAAPLLRGRGEQLPFLNSSFHMVTMGYGLRHVPDLRDLFAEYCRVLKPGGRVLVLEITQPRSAVGRWLNRLYLRDLVPVVARLGSGTQAASRMMQYFWDTIDTCVPPEVILDSLAGAGFDEATRRVTGGVFSEYVGKKLR